MIIFTEIVLLIVIVVIAVWTKYSTRYSKKLENTQKEHKEALIRQQLQYAELQNQINPHFLYNTLETIRGQALIDDNYRIADMTENLAKYFRYNISKNKDDVTLSQELDNIKNYIIIQQYRFQNRFIFDIQLESDDEQCLEYMIPKMTLQPLVENAIFHGIEPKIEMGHISVSVETTDDKLYINVKDDGVGMSEADLKKVRDKLNEEYSDVTSSNQGKHNGIAITNVNARLKLLYGEDFGLHVTSIEGIGTEIEIALPKILRTTNE